MSWQTAELGDICTFVYGKALAANQRQPGPVEVYGSGGLIGSHDAAVAEGPAIIIGRKGSFGSVHYSDADIWPIDTTFYIDKAHTDCELRWLYWVLPCLGLDQLNRAAAVPGLHREDAYRKKLLIPPLEEQRRIAGILDAADALRRRRSKALALLDTLPGAIFAEMFGNRLYGPDRATDTLPLSEVAHIQSGITKGRRLKPSEETEETPYLAVANVQDKRLDLSNVKMIETTEKERERYALVVGDLLLTEGGDPDKLGRGTVWADEIPGAIHQNHIFRVRVIDATVQPIFLSHLLSSPYGRGYFLRMAKQTTGIASINKTQLSGFPAILPDEGEQIEFVQRLKSYQEQKERHISHLGEVDGLFASLQSRAFAGEL